MSGTPQESDVGSYANIQITVSDGSDAVTLTAFTVTVKTSMAVTGSLSLSWTPPATRTDGTTLDLSEIGGYVVYLGTTRDDLQVVVEIGDSATTSYTLDALELGTYFVAVTTYDTAGNASGFSNIVSVDVTE